MTHINDVTGSRKSFYLFHTRCFPRHWPKSNKWDLGEERRRKQNKTSVWWAKRHSDLNFTMTMFTSPLLQEVLKNRIGTFSTMTHVYVKTTRCLPDCTRIFFMFCCVILSVDQPSKSLFELSKPIMDCKLSRKAIFNPTLQKTD